MLAKVRVEVKNRKEARAIETALQAADVRAFVCVVGILSPLPSDRARARVLQFVSDSLDEQGEAGDPGERP